MLFNETRKACHDASLIVTVLRDWPIVACWRHVVTYIRVNIGSDKDLFIDVTYTLHETILTVKSEGNYYNCISQESLS